MANQRSVSGTTNLTIIGNVDTYVEALALCEQKLTAGCYIQIPQGLTAYRAYSMTSVSSLPASTTYPLTTYSGFCSKL